MTDHTWERGLYYNPLSMLSILHPLNTLPLNYKNPFFSIIGKERILKIKFWNIDWEYWIFVIWWLWAFTVKLNIIYGLNKTSNLKEKDSRLMSMTHKSVSGVVQINLLVRYNPIYLVHHKRRTGNMRYISITIKFKEDFVCKARDAEWATGLERAPLTRLWAKHIQVAPSLSQWLTPPP